jgi:hypothetical protein
MAEFVGCTLSAEKLPRVRVIYGNYSRLKPFLQYVKPSSFSMLMDEIVVGLGLGSDQT